MDTFAQVTIPLIILLALRVDTRKAVLMLPLTLVLDLDVFFRYHRLLFHNMFVAFLLPLLFVIYIYRYYPKYFDYSWIGFFYIFSSLIFDLGEGIALLYPLSQNFYFFKTSLYLQFWGPLPLPDLHWSFGIWSASSTAAIGEQLGAAETASRYPSMSETSTGLLITILLAAGMYFKKSRRFLEEIWLLLKDIVEYILSATKDFKD